MSNQSEQSIGNILDEDFANKSVQDIKVRYAYDAQIGYVIRGALTDCFDINIVPLELTYDVELGVGSDPDNLYVTCGVDLLNGDYATLSFTLYKPQCITFDEKGHVVFEEPEVNDLELVCSLTETKTDVFYDFDLESWTDNQNREYDNASGGLKLR